MEISFGGKLIYEFKDKKIFQLNNGNLVIKFLTNNFSASNIINLLVVARHTNIQTCLERQISQNELEVLPIELLPVTYRVTARASKETAKTLGIEHGYKIYPYVGEWIFYSEALNYPVISEQYLMTFNLLSKSEIEYCHTQSHKLFDFFSGFFAAKQYILGYMTFRFGKNDSNNLLLSAEFNSQSLELWKITNFTPVEQNDQILFEILN